MNGTDRQQAEVCYGCANHDGPGAPDVLAAQRALKEMDVAQIRYSMQYAPGIVPGKPWVVRDHALGKAAQTAGLTGPLAYFQTKDEARRWTDDMNAQHIAGTAPPYEVEEYRGGSAAGFLDHLRSNESSGVGEVRFVTLPPLR